jgi:hypothetical protein
MDEFTAEQAKKISQTLNGTAKLSNDSAALAPRYGQIGISAVAAAARYQGNAKTSVQAPTPTK